MSKPVCDVCGKETGGNGCIAINPAMPGSWYYGHWQCQPARAEYAIEEYALQTPAQVREWTLHLSEKRWFVNTDWDALLRRLGLDEGKDYRPAKGGNG